MSSIADRLKIATKGKSRDTLPAIQALINCGDAGTCNGGDSNAANAWVYKNSIPDVTCKQYEAVNMECSAINMCMNCDHDGSPCYGLSSPSCLSFSFCLAIETYPTIKVSEYGTAFGDDQIMAEIYARGPVSAYIDAVCLVTSLRRLILLSLLRTALRPTLEESTCTIPALESPITPSP
jgi:cathepsin X